MKRRAVAEVNPCGACRSYLLRSLSEEGSSDSKPSEEKLRGYAAVLAIGSGRCKSNTLGEGQGMLGVRGLPCR